MKYTTLVALLAAVSANSVETVSVSIPLVTEAPYSYENSMAEINALEQNLTFLQNNPHLIATSYLRQAQGKIADLVKKATIAEHETNQDHIKDIKAQIAKLQGHLNILTEAVQTAALPAKNAMAEMGASFQASSYWDDNWKNPALGSARGVHNHSGQNAVNQWWEVDMPSTDLYTFTDMTLQKRGDGCCQERIIKAVRFQYSEDGNNWKWHEGGKYFITGQTATTPKDDKVKFAIDPPITGANKVRVWIDQSHANSGWYQGRFDLAAKKE